MLILGLDFETTGLDFVKDHIIEIGAVLWDTDTGVPLRIYSELVEHPLGERPAITEEITALTGINEEMLLEHGRPAEIAFARLQILMDKADAVVAHNGNGFDKPMLQAHIDRKMEYASWPELVWIDTRIDVPYPATITTRKLVHLAAEHGFLNPFAHRALFDVLTMLAILQKYSIAEVYHSAQQPMVTVQALVTFNVKDKAKARGFYWDADARVWKKQLRAHLLEEEARACEFEIRRVVSNSTD